MNLRLIICIAVLFAPVLATAGEKWSHITVEDNPELGGNEIQFLKPDKSGHLWVGTLTGLAKVQGANIASPLRDQEGKPRVVGAWDLLTDQDGGLWIGHNQGILHLKDGVETSALNAFTVNPIYRLNDVSLIALAKNRATEQSTLYRFDGNEWMPLNQFAADRVVDIFQASDSAIWVTIEGNGVKVLSPIIGAGEPVHHLQSRNITTIIQDTEGRIWCGLWGRGVEVYDGTKWTHHLEDCKAAVLNCVDDGKGVIWVATNAEGLYAWDGTVWSNHLRDEGVINLLAATPDGRIWVSSQTIGGLRCWDGKTFVLHLDSPMPILSVVQTPDGTTYAGGVLDGLYILK